MQNLSRKELRLITKNRNIYGSKSMSKNELINAVNISKSTNK